MYKSAKDTRPNLSDIVLKDTAKIMERYTLGGVSAEVGYDEDYNIFVRFAPDGGDRRIPIKASNESELEWLAYTDGVKSAEKPNLDMSAFPDAVTGKNYYFLKLFFAGAPYNANQLYLFDAEWGALINYKTLSNFYRTEWDGLAMDAAAHMGSIDAFQAESGRIAAVHPVIIENGGWTMPLSVEITYEIQNGVIIPVEYKEASE